MIYNYEMYEELYGDFYDYFKKIVEANNLKNVSFPFFINLKGQGYDDKKETILVYGLETKKYPSKWKEKTKFKDNQYFNNNINNVNLDDCLELNKICCELFHFPNLDDKKCDNTIKNHYNSPFWYFIRKLRKEYSKENYNIIWSNLVKFDINGKGIGKSDLEKIGKIDLMLKEVEVNGKDKLISEHIKLIKKEINLINPKMIIILGKQKDEETIYNKIIKGIIPNKKNINNDDDIVCKYSYTENKEINIYHTYHPNHLIITGYCYCDVIEKLEK